MEWLSNVFIVAILALTSVSTLAVIANALGLLPESLSHRLRKKRVKETIMVLTQLGVDVEEIKRRNLAQSVSNYFPGTDYSDDLRQNLEKLTIKRRVDVGQTEQQRFSQFIDLMGGSTRPKTARLFARYLSTYLRRQIEAGKVRTSDFDFIACPKEGSPLLGYELASILGKPLVLHVSERKFRTPKEMFKARFDICGEAPPDGATALIVDDSTTGGRKILKLTAELRRFGYRVTDCLVVFVAQGKGAPDKLLLDHIELHSIVDGPKAME